MSENTVIMRADGSETIGMGHVMRCLGLGQELRRRGSRVVFACGIPSQPVMDRILNEGFEYRCLGVTPGSDEDAELTRKACNELMPQLLLVDGYHFTGDWLADLQPIDCSLMLWTDYLQSERLPVSVLLDQNPSADAATYRSAAPDAEILAGLTYAVLRAEFLSREGLRHARTRVNNLMITMGGSDPLNMTPRVLEAMANESWPFSIDVVVGPASKSLDDVKAVAAGMDRCTIHHAVQDMGALIANADLAICAAGITLWEFAYSGLPAIAMSVAENQVPLSKKLAESGGGIDLGHAVDFHPEAFVRQLKLLSQNEDEILAMSKNMLAWVDGKGAERVSSAIASHRRNGLRAK